MARFLLRSFASTVITMLIVSVVLFSMLEARGTDIPLKLLGVFSTENQRISFQKQLGLDRPAFRRYLDWLFGTDWQVRDLLEHPLLTIRDPQTGEEEWWADAGGRPTRWKMVAGELVGLVLQPDGTIVEEEAQVNWSTGSSGESFYWGVDGKGRAVKWVRQGGEVEYQRSKTGFIVIQEGPVEFIPLRRGLLRGDPGVSLQYGRPVSSLIIPRLRNTLVLAAAAILLVMPLALFLGVLAGVHESQPVDRLISIASLGAAATPEFVTGIIMILILGIWLGWLPAATVFLSPDAIFSDPLLLALPLLTLCAAELGYVVRIMRASMIDILGSGYIRTAVLKGLPGWQVVVRHGLRNALLAPITVILLHINWLIGGVVVVEVLFGFPGLGKLIYDAAIFGDYITLEAAAVLLVMIAVGTRLIGDLIYTLLNPRIRYG